MILYNSTLYNNKKRRKMISRQTRRKKKTKKQDDGDDLVPFAQTKFEQDVMTLCEGLPTSP